jgi:hypothetical protein
MTQSRRLAAAVGSASLVAAVLLYGGAASAQQDAPTPPRSGRAGAPIDLTGYWVAEITEDWRWRMVTPAKGDWESVPMTPAAEKVASNWDPARDEAAGEACRSYGAPALMRAPTRLNISWQDDNTLKVETDHGRQTRLLRFGDARPAGSGSPSWQGESRAQWEVRGGRGGAPATGNLKVVTTRLRPGYLRKNGVPYSANTVFTEYWDLIKSRNGDLRILMLLKVEDPANLTEPWVVPVHFKKEPDGSKWDPTPCSASW